MAFGLTDDGFELKRLSDIKAEVETDLKADLGEIATDPDSVFGQVIGVLSKQYADLWELGQDSYNSQYPASASGISLDYVVQLLGLERLDATKTRVQCIIEGSEGTVVPLNNVVSVQVTNERLDAENDVTITKDNVLKSVINIASASSGVEYSTTITYPLTSTPVIVNYTASSETVESIAENLADAINNDVTLSGLVSAVYNDDSTFTIQPDNSTSPFKVDVSDDDTGSRIELEEIWTPAYYLAQNAGAVQALANTVTQIETAVSGFNQVNNLTAGVIGRELETDTELRIRREDSLDSIGAATVETIRSRILQEVPNVVSTFVVENTSDVTDSGGRPPHSFETIVEGGDDNDLAEKIWQLKPAGIATFGNVDGGGGPGSGVDIIDSQGFVQNIKFSRPSSVYAWCYVEITRYAEETFPADGVAQIIEAIRDWGIGLGIGKDVIRQRIYTPIFSVPGVESADIWLSTSTNASAAPVRPIPPTANDYDQTDHEIEADEISIWSFTEDSNNIEVVDIT